MDYVTALFASLYGEPHEEQVLARPEGGNLKIVDWWGKHIWIRIIDSPDQTNLAGFNFQKNFRNSGGEVRGSFQIVV